MNKQTPDYSSNMARKRVWKIFVLTAIALSWLTGLASGKMASTSSSAYRSAKAKQDADRRGTEKKRQQILADSAAKFDHQQRHLGNNDMNDSWDYRIERNINSNCQKYQSFKCINGRDKSCEKYYNVVKRSNDCNSNGNYYPDNSVGKQKYYTSACRSNHRYY